MKAQTFRARWRPTGRAFVLFAALLAALPACNSAERAAEHESNGLLLLEEGRGPEAIVELRTAIDIDPGAHRAAMTLARVYSRSRPAEAVKILEALLAEKPDVAMARMQLGNLYAALGFEKKALVQYDAAAGIASYAPAYLRMASIFEGRREDANAEKALLGALQVSPNDTEALYRLAKLYERVGQPGQARRAWELYLKAGEGLSSRPMERVREAESRVRALAANMTEAEMRESLAALRAELSPNPANPTQTPSLDRPFVGRVFVRIYPSGAEEPVRGVGQGGSLREAIRQAAEQARRSRVFKLFVSNHLDTARVVIAAETVKAEPLTIGESFQGTAQARGFVPGRDAIELRLQGGARSAVVLPTDAAAAGWSTLHEQLDAAALRLGLPSGGWHQARAFTVSTLAFADGPGGVGTYPIEDGLPVTANPVPPGERLDRIRAASTWLTRALQPGGSFAPGYNPVASGGVPGEAGLAARARIVRALAHAANVINDPNARQTAEVGFRALEGALTDGPAEGQRRVPSNGDELAALEATAEISLTAATLGHPRIALETARALQAGFVPATGEGWTLGRVAAALAAAAVSEGDTASGLVFAQTAMDLVERLAQGSGRASLGAADACVRLLSGPAAVAGRALSTARSLNREAAAVATRSLYDPLVHEALATLSGTGDANLGDLQVPLRRVERAALSLQYTEGATWAYPAQDVELLGGFRNGALDPTILSDRTARRIIALLRGL